MQLPFRVLSSMVLHRSTFGNGIHRTVPLT